MKYIYIYIYIYIYLYDMINHDKILKKEFTLMTLILINFVALKRF